MTRTILAMVALAALAAAGCKKKPPADVSGANAPASMSAHLLRPADVTALLSGKVASGPIAGIPESNQYSSLRYWTPTSDYGVAAQVWKLGDAAEAQYLKDLGAYPQAKAKDEVGSRSFRALRDGILYVHFLDKPSGAIVSMTCGVGTCASATKETKMDDLRWEIAVGLARTLQARVGSLPAQPAPSPAPTLAPAAAIDAPAPAAAPAPTAAPVAPAKAP